MIEKMNSAVLIELAVYALITTLIFDALAAEVYELRLLPFQYYIVTVGLTVTFVLIMMFGQKVANDIINSIEQKFKRKKVVEDDTTDQ